MTGSSTEQDQKSQLLESQLFSLHRLQLLKVQML